MAINYIHGDITAVQADVIVNPTDCFYSGSGGVDRAVHRKAGPALEVACSALPALHPGEVCATPGFGLDCRWIVHTFGPVWQGGSNNENVILRSCYVNALLEAVRLGASSVAFPLISAGTFRFPKDLVYKIALQAISDFLFITDADIEVLLCLFDKRVFAAAEEKNLAAYLRSDGEPRGKYSRKVLGDGEFRLSRKSVAAEEIPETLCCAPLCEPSRIAQPKEPTPTDLSAWLADRDETFAVTLLRLIDKKGMKDAACYKKANVSRKTFSKIKSEADYRPSKVTVLSFAIALELTMSETEQLLKTVGYALSRSNIFDMIVSYYITKGIYDIYEINASLYQYDQVCLGCEK